LSAYQEFSYRGANFRIRSDRYDRILEEIVRQRKILSDYIKRQPEFLSALSPLELLPKAPPIARSMHQASLKTGVGPMAAVAGITAQMAARAALKAGGTEAIVENGGDIYLASGKEAVIGLYAGDNPLSGRLGLSVSKEEMPLAICSSSGKMGHSQSMSDCDLATVTSEDAALADAAATLACNLITAVDRIDPVMEQILQIPGIRGILVIKDDRIGMAGQLPEIIKHTDPRFPEKITRDKDSPDRFQR
jgi:ApbE superfamily uncharacterized protein (UPF0280 family)